MVKNVYFYFCHHCPYLAMTNSSRTIRDPSPMNFWTSSEPETRINVHSVWWATARANSVLPVPGGPYSSTPWWHKPSPLSGRKYMQFESRWLTLQALDWRDLGVFKNQDRAQNDIKFKLVRCKNMHNITRCDKVSERTISLCFWENYFFVFVRELFLCVSERTIFLCFWENYFFVFVRELFLCVSERTISLCFWENCFFVFLRELFLCVSERTISLCFWESYFSVFLRKLFLFNG